MFNKILISLAVLTLIVGAMPSHAVHASTTVSLSSIQAGDLIRGQSFSAVYYYGKDGYRYVFPNDKTYFTWYSDFNTVKWLSDADLGKIQIGGNVTYKPGVKMVKIDTDPKVYAVDKGGSLRWVGSEDVAVTLYGNDWNKMIDDVPDGFFTNYTVSDSAISTTDVATTYQANIATYETETINDDKSLTNFQTLEITDNAYSATSLNIHVGDVIRFVNNGSNNHTATANDLSWGSGTISPNGGFWQRRFTVAGSFNFFCSYHPDMTGTIVVSE